MTQTKLPSLEFQGNVSAIRTSMGTWKLTIDIFEADLLTAAKLPDFYQKNVSVAMIQLPGE